jgi:hypothetical protein
LAGSASARGSTLSCRDLQHRAFLSRMKEAAGQGNVDPDIS